MKWLIYKFKESALNKASEEDLVYYYIILEDSNIDRLYSTIANKDLYRYYLFLLLMIRLTQYSVLTASALL